jgi:hypothetical protein
MSNPHVSENDVLAGNIREAGQQRARGSPAPGLWGMFLRVARARLPALQRIGSLAGPHRRRDRGPRHSARFDAVTPLRRRLAIWLVRVTRRWLH